jgi:hypothetical protein
MSQPDRPPDPPVDVPAMTPFAAQVGSALDAAGIAWQLDEDGDLRVTIEPDEGAPFQLFFRTVEPDDERILVAVVFDVLPGVNTSELLPLGRTTVAEVLNWMHQHLLGVTFSITIHNYVACRCAFPVYGRPRREQVETMFKLVLGAVNAAQTALHAALQGASVEQALRLAVQAQDSSPTEESDAED